MELRHLRYFVALAEELSFTRAAQRLHVSQPPLSLQIALLEQELGAQLFVRTSRRVGLTLAGQAFLAEARAVLERLDAARQRVAAIGQGQAGRIEVGLSGSHFLGPFPAALARYRLSHPGVDVVLHEMQPALQQEALRDKRIDVGIARTAVNDDRLASTLLWPDPVVVALSPGHRLAGRKALALGDLRSEPFVMLRRDSSAHAEHMVQCCVQAGFAPRVAQTTVELAAVLSLVAAGLGVALVPSSLGALFAPRVVFKPLGAKAPRADVHAVQRRDDAIGVVPEFVRMVSGG
ncbi:LysR substrate-binding domain-containing protein [Acidovorax sp. Q11]